MSCFSSVWLENFLIWLAVVVFLVAVVSAIIPRLTGWVGSPPGGDLIITILRWFVWLVIIIAIIIFVFDLVSCMTATGRLRI